MMARALVVTGLLAAGLVLGLAIGRLRLSEPGPASPLPDTLPKQALRSIPAPAVVDASGLPADEQAVADKLHLRAAFVCGTELQSLDRFLGGTRPNPDRLERQIYLVACLEPQENTGPRLLSVTLEIVRPKYLAGKTLRLLGGLLVDDCVYHVEQMIDTDTLMPGDPTLQSLDGKYVYAGDEGPSLREEIVRSRPEFRIVTMHIH